MGRRSHRYGTTLVSRRSTNIYYVYYACASIRPFRAHVERREHAVVARKGRHPRAACQHMSLGTIAPLYANSPMVPCAGQFSTFAPRERPKTLTDAHAVPRDTAGSFCSAQRKTGLCGEVVNYSFQSARTRRIIKASFTTSCTRPRRRFRFRAALGNY